MTPPLRPSRVQRRRGGSVGHSGCRRLPWRRHPNLFPYKVSTDVEEVVLVNYGEISRLLSAGFVLGLLMTGSGVSVCERYLKGGSGAGGVNTRGVPRRS